jgi:hypothetical protein
MNHKELLDTIEDAAVALMDGPTIECAYLLFKILSEHRVVEARLLESFKEMHRDEVKRDHYGDGAENCTYCMLIRRLDG